MEANAINDVSNCYPYINPYVYPTTSTYYGPYTNYVDGVKAEAIRIALEAKKGRPWREITKLADQIEEYLRG